MNKKILISSIMAVAVLIGVSFTSVVGYRSVTSDVNVSPLFNIRTNRAIDEEGEDLRCEYVGKGEEINILILKIDDKIALFQKVMDKISKMDDETNYRFFYQIRDNPGRINLDINHNSITYYCRHRFLSRFHSGCNTNLRH